MKKLAVVLIVLAFIVQAQVTLASAQSPDLCIDPRWVDYNEDWRVDIFDLTIVAQGYGDYTDLEDLVMTANCYGRNAHVCLPPETPVIGMNPLADVYYTPGRLNSFIGHIPLLGTKITPNDEGEYEMKIVLDFAQRKLESWCRVSPIVSENYSAGWIQADQLVNNQ